jgi:hypothetical protein
MNEKFTMTVKNKDNIELITVALSRFVVSLKKLDHECDLSDFEDE